MSQILASLDIPTEVISVLFLLLISLANWIKNRALAKRQVEEDVEEEDPMREVIWRRQIGELEEAQEFRGEPPPMPMQTIRVDPRQPVMMATPPPTTPPPLKKTVVSEKEAALAARFENAFAASPRRKSFHRKQVDRLLRSPSAAKDAILLTEILGPPLALKPKSEH